MEIRLNDSAAKKYDMRRFGTMTPETAAGYLQEGNITLYTFAEALQEEYTHPDLQSRLITSFCEFEPDMDPDSIRKKVQNWLRGANHPSQREDVFRIAFILGLTEDQCSLLLGQCTEYGIHYRDSRDVIYAWFLRNGLSYIEARDFYDSLPYPPSPDKFPPIKGDITDSYTITRRMQSAFHSVRSTDQLREVYMENINDFGHFHVRAYRYFDKYLHRLVHPDTRYVSVDEKDYSLDSIMKYYLSLNMPSGRNRSHYTLVQKLLKKNWPNTTALKNIISHHSDVPRKLILLLYVVTENVGDYDDIIYDNLPLQDRLEQHWWMLDAILTDCGMPTLDPRNVTDWLVLYSLTAPENTSMSDRMAAVIEKLFESQP